MGLSNQLVVWVLGKPRKLSVGLGLWGWAGGGGHDEPRLGHMKTVGQVRELRKRAEILKILRNTKQQQKEKKNLRN